MPVMAAMAAMAAMPMPHALQPMQQQQEVELSEEQRAVMDSVMSGANVFFTGKAGTGKTTLLRAIVAGLRARLGPAEFKRRVAVTALTGVAATHIQGQTLHAALGLGTVRRHRDVQAALMRADVRKRVMGWQVLVVDECSMLSAELLDALERALREVRGSHRPAGGLQIVMCGDFFQLPPVTKQDGQGHNLGAAYGGSLPPSDAFLNAGYAFETPAWQRMAFEHSVLTRAFRQGDTRFVELLDAVRIGGRPGGLACSAVAEIARLCARPLEERGGIRPTQIYTRNRDVDDLNAAELAKLPGPKVAFAATDTTTLLPDAPSEGRAMLKRSDFFKDCLAAPQLELAVGAQVMLLKNLDVQNGMVNGSRGVVVRFTEPGGQPVVRFINGREEAIAPVRFSAEVHSVGECVRVQVPLKLAWALTVHKSQGMTLDYVRVSLRGVFAAGQAYVALSRARSLEGLQVTDYEPGCARSDPLVRGFYKAVTPGLLPDAESGAWWDRVHASWRERMGKRACLLEGDAYAFVAS